jgi:putative CocE/NonD family hydrolase
MTKNVSGNNGRVGMLGVSYDGWLVTMALLDPHPALKAASEQASPADMFLGDDFHHNGAFRLSYGFEYAALLETVKEANTNFVFDHADTYQSYLDLGVLSNANERYFHGKVPTWNDFVAHPNYDEFWQKQAFPRYINGSPQVPNLNVAGWWDQEDFYGPLRIYDLFEKSDPQHLNYMVAGPWNHGGWRRADGSKLGDISFDSNTSKYFRQHIEAPWFAYWLHDKGSRNFAEATVFQTGSNQWERYDSWPPASSRPTNLYMRAGGKLSFEAPLPTNRMPPTRTSPIPRTRSHTAVARLARLIQVAAGPLGSSRTNASLTTALMCSAGRPSPYRMMSRSRVILWPASLLQRPAAIPIG